MKYTAHYEFGSHETKSGHAIPVWRESDSREMLESEMISDFKRLCHDTDFVSLGDPDADLKRWASELIREV